MSIIATLARASSISRIISLVKFDGMRYGLYPSDTAHTSQNCISVRISEATQDFVFEMNDGTIVYGFENMNSDTLQAIACCFEKYYA